MRTLGILLLLMALGCSAQAPLPTAGETAPRVPVILDTDIGTDIDDTWALALLLNMPEFDVRLVVTDSGDTVSRARVAAKFLERAGRSDIPLGVGTFISDSPVHQLEWAQDYQLEQYPGSVHEDGVGALIRTIRESPEPVTLLVIGPAPNIAEALQRDPAITRNARIIAMSGSIDVGYDGKDTPDAEYNVRADAPATRAMYEAAWEVLIAPLDTAGTIRLEGDTYSRVLASRKPEIIALIENYRVWAKKVEWTKVDTDRVSSVLFDTLAVALLESDQWVELERVRVQVTDDGFTRRADVGPEVVAALRWKDRDAYHGWLVSRLLEP